MFVSINMATSMDGKIATERRGPVKLGSAYDSRRMAEIRAEHDAVVMGGGTYRVHPHALLVDHEDLVRTRLGQGKAPHPITVVVTRRLDFPARSPLARQKDVERMIVAGAGAAKKRILEWERAGVKVEVAASANVRPQFVLKRLAAMGVERVLLEGGGEFNALFFEANLVDRVHLTICPMAIGGSGAPTFFEGKGFPIARAPRFKLSECRPVGDELYLTYDRAKA